MLELRDHLATAYFVPHNLVYVADAFAKSLSDLTLEGLQHSSKFEGLLKHSPLDFMSIFIGRFPINIANPITAAQLNMEEENLWWIPFAFSSNSERVKSPLLKSKRESIKTNLEHKVAHGPKEVSRIAGLLSEYFVTLFSSAAEVVDPLFAGYSHFLFTNGSLENVVFQNHSVKNNVIDPPIFNGGFVKSYSSLNWFHFTRNFSQSSSPKANLVILDPPSLQLVSNTKSTSPVINSLEQVNRDLPEAIERLTNDNFCFRVLESALEVTTPDAILFIWCSLEQSLKYLQINNGKKLEEKGLKELTVCGINGEKSAFGASQQIPTNAMEFFIVAKKGNPQQTTFSKWGFNYQDGKEPTFQGSHFVCPNLYWQRLPNTYSFMKPQELMRDFIHQYSLKGHLIIEGFSGSKSCILGAVTKGANLICVDNNPESEKFTRKMYARLCHQATILEINRNNLADGCLIDECDKSVFSWPGKPLPEIQIIGPDNWNRNLNIVTPDTEFSIFTQAARSQGKGKRLPESQSSSDKRLPVSQVFGVPDKRLPMSQNSSSQRSSTGQKNPFLIKQLMEEAASKRKRGSEYGSDFESEALSDPFDLDEREPDSMDEEQFYD